MDAAARKRKSREKLNSDPEKLRLHLEKEKQRDNIRRQKKTEKLLQNKGQLDQKRQADRIRQRRCREKKALRKESNNISASPAYKCKHTLRKAVNKTKRALPISPTKQQAVVLELAKATLPPQFINKKLLSATLNKRSDSLSQEHTNLVKSFYESDDVSRQTPNRKDVVRIRSQDNNEIITIAKRHLVMTVSEVFQLFKQKHPDVKIQKSKFFELRPFHVHVMSEIPHNVCVCKYHANFGFLVDSLKDILHPTVNSSSQLLQEICCDVDNIDCMTGECDSCFNVRDLVNLNADLNAETKWQQWSESSEGWLQIEEVKGIKKDALREIDIQKHKFKTHCFVKKEQSHLFEKKKLETTETEGVLQIDFAENFSIIAQDEIQSAHWKHPQATLFTCCVWFEKGQKLISYIIISNDELSHDKFAVWLYLKMIIEDLKKKNHGLTKLTAFSDGCTAQFKNRFTISTVHYSNEDWGVKIDWAFFATSHGKGAVDGLGAAAKRRMWNAIKARKAFINSAWDCFFYLAGDPKGIIYLFASIYDITQYKEMVLTRWEDLNMLPQLRKNHFFQSDGKNHILFSLTGSSPTKKAAVFKNKIIYEDVYSESEEEILESEHDRVAMEINECRKDKNEGENEITVVDGQDENEKWMDERDKNEKEIDDFTAAGCSGLNNPKFNSGDYVLVKFPGKKIEYRYVGITNQIDYNEDEAVITFLRMSDKAAKLFKVVDDDISEIPFEHIVEKLPTPSIVQKGDRLFYKFIDSVNIYEK